jgi:formiminotetrahydrofolate cyclodeaminase
MPANKSLRELLEAFSAPTPTPGGGSAAALTGAVAAALLAMVAGMKKTRTGAPSEREALDTVRLSLLSRMSELVELIQRDASAYDQVMAAYRLPKATEADVAARKAAVAKAMRVATEVPLETARAASALIGHGAIVAQHGNPNAKSDVGVALSLAMTAFGAARVNVETNLDDIDDAAFVAVVRQEIDALARDDAARIGPSFDALGWTGQRM